MKIFYPPHTHSCLFLTQHELNSNVFEMAFMRLPNTIDLRQKLKTISAKYSICPEPIKSYPNALISTHLHFLGEMLQIFYNDKLEPTEDYPNRKVWVNLNSTLEEFLNSTETTFDDDEERENLLYELKIEMQSRYWGNKKNIYGVGFSKLEKRIERPI